MSTEAAVLGADTANQQAGGSSFFDNATMFTGSAVLSGLASIYNTAVDYGSKIGIDADRLDTGRILENYDANWYNYYKENKSLIDTAGFVGTSFIPGTLAIKGLKVAQAGMGAGAIGRAVSGTLNFANAKRDASLAAGLDEIASEGGSAYAYINANKLASMSWGVADQALQAGAFEAATALTMKQSPLLADKSTPDMLSDMGYGMLVGGAFGGAIDAVLTNRVFKNAVEAVAGKQRKFDTPAYYSNLGLGIGDEAFGFVDSLLKLPKEVLFDDRYVSVPNTLTKGQNVLDLEKQLTNTLTKTERKMYDQVQLSLQQLGTQATPEAGQAAGAMIIKMVRDGVGSGATPGEIKQSVGNYLLGLEKFEIIGDTGREAINYNKPGLFYLNHEVDLKTLGIPKLTPAFHTVEGDVLTNPDARTHVHLFSKLDIPQSTRKLIDDSGFVDSAGKYYSRQAAENLVNLGEGPLDAATYNRLGKTPTIDDFLTAAKSRTPFPKNATARPYEVVGDVKNTKITTAATTFEQAWEGGNDMAIIGGKVRINPDSTIFSQVRDPVLTPSRFINAKTGGVSDDVVPTWADKLPAGAKPSASILTDGVLHGKTALKVADEISPSDAYTATARHAWASSLKPDHFAGLAVDASDISRLERLNQFDRATLEGLGTTITDADGGVSNAANVDLARLLSDAKISKMQEMLDAGVTDMREIGYVINSDDSYMERVIANGFNRTADDTLMEGASRPLTDYLKRENFLATWASPRSLVSLGNVSEDVLKATEEAAKSKGAKYVDTFVTGELGFTQRVALTSQATVNAFTSVFGSATASRFLDVDVRKAMQMADELGIGAGVLSTSNADYGDILKLWSQHSGMLTHQLIQKVVDVNLVKLQPFITKIAGNPEAGAELGIVLNMLRRSGDKFVIAVDPKSGLERLAVRETTKIEGSTGQRIIAPDKLEAWQKANMDTGSGGKPKQAVFEVTSSDVMDFLHTWVGVNGDRINKRAVLLNSRGGVLGWDPDVVYAPPINTQKYPYFAFVKIKEGHIAGGSDVGMLTAKTSEELSKLSQEIDTEKYDVFFKENTERYFKVKNEYDAGLSLNEPRIDSNLRKQGKLGDFFYETRPQSVLEDFIGYSQAADTALVRHGVETRYAQLITELGALGKQYTEVATSQMSGVSRFYDKSAVNPFGDYVNTALDISKRSSFPLVHQLNEFVDSVGTAAYRALIANTDKAKKGIISWEEAEKIATKYGIGGVYNADNVATAYAVANRPMDRNLIKIGVSKLNSFLATAGLRLDTANALVNTISMPMMLGTELASLKSLATKDPSAIGALSDLLNLKLTNPDGTVLAVPGGVKLLATAMKNVIGPGGKDLIAKYRAAGDVKGIMAQFHEMMDDVAINPRVMPKEWSKKIDSWIDKGATWTGNNYAEDLTRALSANVMDQLTAPLVERSLLTSQEANAYRSVFVNRVNGNYIASQRPILFQGTVGSAISLFQTYIFNVMQQMTRHVENRDTRALLTMGGLQGGLYGLNGLPFFEAVNTHLIGNASINDGHRDIYSATTQLAGKELGDWLLYGTASALPIFGDKSPSLYTRGDINPRHISVLPISPLDIPAVDVTRRMVANIADIGSKIVRGGSVGASLLEGLEHNGVSRPLAGMAQVAAGRATTGKGSLVSAANEFDLTVAATRMLGAKPLDESILMNTMYRQNSYKAADLDRLNKLGEAVKTKLRNNQMPEPEDMQNFMKQYASAGGNISNYGSALSRWSRDANMSVVNQLAQFHNSQYAERMREIMGGTTLEDYRNAGAASSMQPPAQ